ncbi:MAG: hypothetical protein AB8B55_00275 [Mariniblastus sp.]
MASKQVAQTIKVSELEGELSSLFESLVSLQALADLAKHKKLTEGANSMKRARERIDGAIDRLNKSLRELEEDNFDAQLATMFSRYVELQSKVDEAKFYAKRGKVPVYGLSSLALARQRIDGVVNLMQRKVGVVDA